MIPKIIHYCWFGGNPKPKLAENCIKSWKKYCWGYKIVEWNERNYDLSQAPLYVRQAYEAKKWAFVTDYVRLQVVYEQGGIYMDTDVELLKKPDELLRHNAFFGFENGKHIATGLGFGAVQGCGILKDLMEDYQELPFILEDGTYNLTPCPVLNLPAFLKYGLQQDNSLQILEGDILILPRDYLSPVGNGPEGMGITENTVSIHWFSGSWCSAEEQQERENFYRWMKNKSVLEFLSRTGKRLLGDSLYPKLRDLIKKIR